MNGNGMMKGMGPGMTHGTPGRGLADAEHIDELKVEARHHARSRSRPGSKYAKQVQDAAAAIKTSREGVDPQAVSKMNPADRFAFVTKMREQGQKQFETVKAAANELLTALDDKQKAEALDLLPGNPPRRVRPRHDARRRHGRPAAPTLRLAVPHHLHAFWTHGINDFS